MIVLGNPEFATGMKLAGLKESHIVRKREDAIELVKKLDPNEFILANVSVIKLLPELNEFRNMVSIPDKAEAYGSTEDLKNIIKSAVGIELQV